MNKGLEALRRICLHLVAHDETQHKEFDEYVNAIEKELEEAEENKKMLDIFKNALTVEYKPFSIEMQKESKDFVSLLCKNIATIRENELDKNLRAILKKWVLKNAFPKELKALEILRKGNFEFGDKHSFHITLNSGITLTREEYDLLKEVLGDE